MKPIEPGCLALVLPNRISGVQIITINDRWEDRRKCRLCGRCNRYWDRTPDDGKTYCECVLTRIDGYDESTDTQDSAPVPGELERV